MCEYLCADIMVSGQKYYFRAVNDKERDNWIERLQDASRITVIVTNCISYKLHASSQF